MHRIVNALVYTEDGFFMPGAVGIEGERISRVQFDGAAAAAGVSGADNESDARGCYVIPGLIDIHVHGCVGYDFSDADYAGVEKMLRYQAASGVTAVCPTTMTLPEDALAKACETLAGFWHGAPSDAGNADGAERARTTAGGPNVGPARAAVPGVFLEGPFISPNKAGAQNPAHARKPDLAMFRRLQDIAGGAVKMLAVAPELEGASELIEALRGEVVLSIAHTTADFATAAEAVARGASHATHLYNAMPTFAHREPGAIGAVFDSERVTAEVICDGVHLHPAAIRIALRQLGRGRVVFVSDSMMATGLGDGLFELGGQAVRVKDRVARLVEGGNIASSVSNLMDCVRIAVKQVGIPLADAVRCASANSAQVVGIEREYGGIAAGKYADLVLLNSELEVTGVYVHGRRLE